MENRIAETIAGLISQGELALAGLIRHGDAIGITKVTPAGLKAEITGYINGDVICTREKTRLSELRATANGLVDEGREYVRLSREVLKPKLGKKPSVAWVSVGMDRSHAVPVEENELLRMLTSFAAYFADHPEHENAPLDVIGSRATTLFNKITAARNAVGAQKTALADALAARDAHGAALRKMLRILIKELSIHLHPMDNVYLSFGLNRPGQKATPDAPTNVVVVVNGNDATVKWSKSPRAEHYHVSEKNNEGGFTRIATRDACDFSIEVSSNHTRELAISAVNNRGESQLSQVVVVQSAARNASNDSLTTAVAPISNGTDDDRRQSEQSTATKAHDRLV